MPRIVAYMRNHMIDAHLTIVQTCRVCLSGFGIVAFAAAIGSGPETPQRLRMQCAAAAAACAISTRYYTRLYTLRRLPLAMGYSLESNTVAESMRYANWSIVVALLGWTAFLLRGPFETELYGPWLWEWDYATWQFVGPLMSCFGTIVGLPGWHASRTARANQLKGERSLAFGWMVACFFFLGISVFTSLTVGAAMISPTRGPDADGVRLRTNREVFLGRSISALWFVYPIVSLVRTMAIILGAGDWTAPIEGGDPTVGASGSGAGDRRPGPRPGLVRGIAAAIGTTMAQAIRGIYLAMVAAPECKSTVAVTRLTALADGIPLPSRVTRFGAGRHDDSELDRLLPMSDLVERADAQTIEAEEQSLQMRMHIPEVTPLCSMGVDSTIAVVDIFSQAISALGCAAITLPLIREGRIDEA